ncbi:MAG: DsrE family protein [Thermoanaerobacteraceae bacterium]
MKKVLFAVYNSPVGSIWINEALRSAFGMYGEEIKPSVLFINDASLAVKKQCNPELIGCLPLSITFKYIEKYGTDVYAIKEDIKKYNINDEDVDPHWNLKIIEETNVPDFVHDFDKVIFF